MLRCAQHDRFRFFHTFSPLGRGWTATALSSAVAGRVRGHFGGGPKEKPRTPKLGGPRYITEHMGATEKNALSRDCSLLTRSAADYGFASTPWGLHPIALPS
jgi:hypothetical protein